MRRRSERKKSVEASPAASSRRSSRRTRRSPDIEKNEDFEQNQDETPTPTKTDSSPNGASSEERIESTRRGRVTRKARTPAKRRLRNLSGADKQIDCIVEEENGVTNKLEEKIEEEDEEDISAPKADLQPVTDEYNENRKTDCCEASEIENLKQSTVEGKTNIGADDANACEPKLNLSREEQNITEVLMTGTKLVEGEKMTKKDEKDPMSTVEPTHEEEREQENKSKILENTNKHAQDDGNVMYEKEQKNNDIDKDKDLDKGEHNSESEKRNGQKEFYEDASLKEAPPENEIPNDKKQNLQVAEVQVQQNNNNIVSTDQPRSRKRKWLSKKPTDGKDQIMAISTDSLKNLIADVQPVPLSDVQLESSSEVEEVASERDEIIRESSSSSRSPSDNEPCRNILDTKEADKINKTAENVVAVNVPKTVLPALQNSPSPPRNLTSNVLFITNLVRPFTVMQLKGLLARTGKIMENGFWIDRIKSRCYVQYETEDEAIETRHALHGVRWPVSNPKCLNVDFGDYADMERAIKTTSDETPKYGQDYKENFMTGSGWNREHQENDEKKNSKPIREWDVGKKESREKRDTEKREQRSPKDSEKEDKYKKNRGRQRDGKSNSLSPARKVKKEEPPLRLLDDLFRKTKAAPCIYWLPLTPEQIAEKEAFRQKRIEERKERMKQRELEREKEHDLDRGRDRDRSRERVKSRERDRSRDRRRNRSNERRRSRSRDRRRY